MSVNIDGYNTPHSGMAKEKVDRRLQALEDEVDVLKALVYEIIAVGQENLNDDGK